MTAKSKLPQTLFGTGPAEKYLVDTLNELQKKRVTAKCMAMISASRSWSYKFGDLLRSGVLSVQEVTNLMRLFKAEQAQHYAALNKALDEELAAWAPELTPAGLVEKQLEARAFKLAMNIARACMKEIGSYVVRLRVDQLRRERQLQNARRTTTVNIADLKLSVEQETKVLRIISTALGDRDAMR